jgi:hypothetical protein
MFISINGAFGIGKSTVARELRSLLPQSAIFDPEWVGLALQRMPGPRISDFQDLASWRRLTVIGAAGEPASGVEERSPVEMLVVIRRLLMVHDRSSFEGWTLGEASDQPDVPSIWCTLAGPCPAEERHHETP